MVRFEFWNSGEDGLNLSLPLLPGPLRPGVVVPVRVGSMDQIDLSEIV